MFDTERRVIPGLEEISGRRDQRKGRFKGPGRQINRVNHSIQLRFPLPQSYILQELRMSRKKLSMKESVLTRLSHLAGSVR